jgi:hypothetical protein
MQSLEMILFKISMPTMQHVLQLGFLSFGTLSIKYIFFFWLLKKTMFWEMDMKELEDSITGPVIEASSF